MYFGRIHCTEHPKAGLKIVFVCFVFTFLNRKYENAVKETLVRGSNRKAVGMADQVRSLMESAW